MKGLKAQALTDHGSLAGCLPFYYAMREEKLLPLLGAEFYYADHPTVKDEANRSSAHLILIAKNDEGWRNLLRLSKLSWSEGFYYKPRIGIEWLAKHHEGLICLTACLGGVLSREVWREKDKKVTLGLEARFQQLSAIFERDLYVEFQGHPGPEQAEVNAAFMGRLRNFPFFQGVITNDCHYILPEHAKVQELVKTSAYGKSEAAQSYTSYDTLWLKKPGQVLDAFGEHHPYMSRRFVVECMTATEEIVAKCANFELPQKRYLPRFSETESSDELFRKLTTTALAAFVKQGLVYGTKQDYIERFKKEYRVITKYGLSDYFLIVWDICRWARGEGIYVGIGRGSSAGSLIAFLLEIVKIDPIQYKLLFERFLNANRAENGEPPDVDMDFESDRRDEVKRYIFDRYGSEHVCEIGTYGRMMLKTAIVDFGKQFDFSSKELLQITTTLGLDKTEAQNLDVAMANSPRLKSMMRKNPVYEMAVRAINGQIKSQSIHPAGVLISSEPIETVTPLKTQKRGNAAKDERALVTQSEDKYVIAQGLLKMDLLGLKEYDINKFVVEHSDGDLTHANYFDKIHNAELEDSDREVWRMFRTGQTDAVFQFGSGGMKQLLIDMRADCIADLIAAVALYRPGCLENNWHTRYYKRKRGEEEVSFPHPVLAETLSDTYGVCVYQEQFMETFHKLGGISLVDADTIRSALGKKDDEKLEKFRDQFIAGAALKMGSDDAAAEVWDQLAKAAGYTFNRSHSAVYALLAYISQWMKVHHTVAFWTAVLEWDTRKKKWDDVLVNKRAAAAMGVRPLMPDINASRETFVIEAGQPRWSLSGIAGVGPKAAAEIVACQPYLSLKDFYGRVHKGKVKFNNVEALIYAGAFDALGDRCDHIAWLYGQKKGKTARACPKLSPENLLREYYKVIGFFERRLWDVFDGFAGKKYLFTEQEVCETCSGENVLVGGMVADVKTFKTKKGDAMGRVTLVDLDEKIDLTFFPQAWTKYRALLKEGRLLQVAGQKSDYGGRQNQVEVKEVEAIGGSDLPETSDDEDIDF